MQLTVDMPAWLAALLIAVVGYLVISWTRHDVTVETKIVLPSDEDLEDSHE